MQRMYAVNMDIEFCDNRGERVDMVACPVFVYVMIPEVDLNTREGRYILRRAALDYVRDCGLYGIRTGTCDVTDTTEETLGWHNAIHAGRHRGRYPAAEYPERPDWAGCSNDPWPPTNDHQTKSAAD